MLQTRRLLLVLVVFLALLPLQFFAAEAVPVPPTAPAEANALSVGANPEIMRFVRERVQPVLTEHCAECHGDGHRKGGFRLDTLELMLRSEGDFGSALVPWDTKASAIVRAIRHEGDSDLNMPPKYKLPQAQIDDVVHWIEIGAPWPNAAASPVPIPAPTVSAAPASAAPTPAPAASASAAAPAPAKPPFIGRLHPVLVHLPIGALLVAFALELLALCGWRALAVAVLPVVAVALCGAGAAITSGLWLAEVESAAIERHELLGWCTAIAAALTIVAGVIMAYRGPAWRWLMRAFLLAAVALAGATGHTGGGMVWGSGWLW